MDEVFTKVSCVLRQKKKISMRNVMLATLDPALTALKVMTGEGRVYIKRY